MDLMIDWGSPLVPPVTINDSKHHQNNTNPRSSSHVDADDNFVNSDGEEAPDATTVSISTRSLDTMSSMDSAGSVPCTTEEQQQGNSSSAASHDKSSPGKASATAVLRKAGVAVVGSTVTVVGLIMIPLPTPCGALIAASGMTLLGTEFEGANNVVQQCRASVVAGCENVVQRLDKQLQVEQQQPQQTQQQEIQQEEVAEEDGATSLVISVNVDAYEPQQLPQPETNNNNNSNQWGRWRKNLMGSTRSFLADTLLPVIRPSADTYENGTRSASTTAVRGSDTTVVNTDEALNDKEEEEDDDVNTIDDKDGMVPASDASSGNADVASDTNTIGDGHINDTSKATPALIMDDNAAQ